MRRPASWYHRLLLAAACRVWQERSCPPMPVSDVSRLLIVRVDERLGNLLGLQPLLDVLRLQRPRCRLGLLASIKKAAVVGALEGLEYTHLLDKRWFFSKPWRWRRVIEEVRRLRYQAVIDASAWHEFSFTHAVLSFYSGAPLRLGYRREVRSTDWPYTHPVTPGPAGEYEVAQRLRLLRPLGIETVRIPPLRTKLGEQQIQAWQAWMHELDLPRPWIGLWFGARKRERRWPLQQWQKLATALARDGAGVLLLRGPQERGLAERLYSQVAGGAVLAPDTSVDELAGLMRCLDLVVSNDTGPMHLSVAVGCPTVAVFASGTPGRWGHPGPGVINLPCPGSDTQAEFERVLAACRQLIQSATRSTSAPR